MCVVKSFNLGVTEESLFGLYHDVIGLNNKVKCIANILRGRGDGLKGGVILREINLLLQY